MKVEDAIDAFLAKAEKREQFWNSLSRSNGTAELICSLDGRQYQGLSINPEQLTRLASLKVRLGFEIYAVDQNS